MDKEKKSISLGRLLLDVYLLWIGTANICIGFDSDRVVFCIIGALCIWEGIRRYPIIPSSFANWLLGVNNEPEVHSKDEKKEDK